MEAAGLGNLDYSGISESGEPGVNRPPQRIGYPCLMDLGTKGPCQAISRQI